MARRSYQAWKAKSFRDQWHMASPRQPYSGVCYGHKNSGDRDQRPYHPPVMLTKVGPDRAGKLGSPVQLVMNAD